MMEDFALAMYMMNKMMLLLYALNQANRKSGDPKI